MDIIWATAIYTGGGMYCYYAELSDGNWIMGGDEWLIIVNENPLSEKWKYDYGYESDYQEWQVDHIFRYISDDEYQTYLDLVLEEIFKGNTIKEFDNFSTEELKERYSR